MKTLLAAALVVANLTPQLAEAQRQCRTGIPCGGTCISASKTCRVGSPPPSSPAPTTQPASLPSAAPGPRLTGDTAAPPFHQPSDPGSQGAGRYQLQPLAGKEPGWVVLDTQTGTLWRWTEQGDAFVAYEITPGFTVAAKRVVPKQR